MLIFIDDYFRHCSSAHAFSLSNVCVKIMIKINVKYIKMKSQHESFFLIIDHDELKVCTSISKKREKSITSKEEEKQHA